MPNSEWALNPRAWVDLIVIAAILLTVILMGNRVIALVLDKGFKRLTRRTRTGLDDVLVEVLRVPLYWLLIAVTLRILTNAFSFYLPPSIERRLPDVFYVLHFMAGFLFIWRLVDRLSIWYGKEIARRTETNLDEQLMPFFRRVMLIVVALVGSITLLSHFGVNVTAMVTTLGIGSLAIALAAQTALSDAINGFLIMVDRPFRVGDRIEILDLNTWGDVVDIGLRSTRVRTRDNRMVIVPNSVIGQSLVVNHSYPNETYRIQTEVGVAYGTDIERAREVMVRAVRSVEGVLQDRPVEALFIAFGDSALIFRLRWWIRSYTDTRQMFDRVHTAVYHALAEAGITIPFPQRDVHHKVDPEDRAVLAQLLRGEE